MHDTEDQTEVKEKRFDKIYKDYFGPTLELRIQFFNLLGGIGLAAGIAIGMVSAFFHAGFFVLTLHLMISLISCLMLLIAKAKKCYKICSWIWIISIFIFIFPALFFFSGGHKSGTTCYFLLAFAFTVVLLDKKSRVTALFLEYITFIGCCLAAFFYPELIVKLPSEIIYVIHIIFNFSFCGIMIIIMFIARNRIIYNRQNQVEELNRELAARNETLQLYDQMKSNFLAMVAHEINTPLAVIAASSNDTLDLLDEEPINIEEVKQNQVVIERRVKMIDSVVLDLMDKVAIENGRLSLSRQPINLPDLLVTVCETHLQKFDLNNNELIFDFQSDMPAIWADSLRIEQVMVNILTNSFRHTKNGTITVSVKRSDGMQTVSVTDTGEGMDAEMVRVVLKFYISTKTDYWRHGIGLNICRKIVTAHGGDMSIESEEGCGTTVRFSLKEDISDA